MKKIIGLFLVTCALATNGNPAANQAPMTPLHEAAFNGSVENIVALIESGAYSVNELMPGTNSRPLHFAAANGHTKCVKKLLEYKAAVNATAGVLGWTPLHFAVMYGHAECAQELLMNKANVNAISLEGVTPLYCATTQGHDQCIKVLMLHGAKLYI